MAAKEKGGGGDGELDDLPSPDLKIILLGDSATGKSKLIERYLMDEYNPRQLSTYALTLFRKEVRLDGESSVVDFWDTAGQEAFNRMHPSYYYRAHCCILLFDVTRKVTYQHLADWYKELREYCENIPVVLVANKIDVDYNVSVVEIYFPRAKQKHKQAKTSNTNKISSSTFPAFPPRKQVTRKEFKFAAKHNLPFFFVSAADGTNVVKVFESAILEAKRFKESGGDVLSDMLDLLGGAEKSRK
jgi:Rab-like protein 2